MAEITYVTVDGTVYSDEDQVHELAPMSPSADIAEIREYILRLHQWHRTREPYATGGQLAKYVTHRDLIRRTAETGGGSGIGAYIVVCSDLTSDLEPNTVAGYFRARTAFTLAAIYASLEAASTSGAVQIAVTVNGTAMLSTNLTVDAGSKTSVGAAVPPVISVSAVPDDGEIRIEIVSPGAAARGLIVYLVPA